MDQDAYNKAFEDGLRAAARTAERTRDVCIQRGRHDEAAGAERVRVLIQRLYALDCHEEAAQSSNKPGRA